MIQRLQTLFLALATLLTLAVFFTPLYSRAIEDPATWISYSFATVLTIAMMLTVYAIFLYTDRKKQVQWIKFAMYAELFGLAFGVGITFSLGGIGIYLWDESLGVLAILAALAFQYGALYRVKKDDELVRSMDRIR